MGFPSLFSWLCTIFHLQIGFVRGIAEPFLLACLLVAFLDYELLKSGLFGVFGRVLGWWV
jgi:hypothetical protein